MFCLSGRLLAVVAYDRRSNMEVGLYTISGGSRPLDKERGSSRPLDKGEESGLKNSFSGPLGLSLV